MRKIPARTVIIIRNRKCRKSDIVVRFLEKEKIPFKANCLRDSGCMGTILYRAHANNKVDRYHGRYYYYDKVIHNEIVRRL